MIKFLIILAFVIIYSECTNLHYNEVNISVKLDHFSFDKIDVKFNLRVLINDSFWSSKKPIFFYTGNEGSITTFAENSGFMWEIAPEYNAMVVFAEHRFYGTSMPCGELSLKNVSCYKYLTSEQALEDFVEVIQILKVLYSCDESCPVVAFGGSYGGMLSAWFRIKYPNIVAGALASSAPIFQFSGLTQCDKFFNTTTNAFVTSHGPKCKQIIQQSWNSIDNQNLDYLNKQFKICSPLNSTSQKQILKAYLTDFYVTIAMVNYPYPTSFLLPLPGNPVAVFCDSLVNYYENYKPDILESVSAGIWTLLNSSAKCLEISGSASPNLDADGWSIQSCNEMVFPSCSDNITDMFEPSSWNLTDYIKSCRENFQINSDPDRIKNEFWGKRLSEASNIFFSNGLLDPWSQGGVLSQISPKCPISLMRGAAHHLELRASNSLDPGDVVLTRVIIRQYIYQWIKNWQI